MLAKGISPVIASIILVLVVVSLGAAYLAFTGRLTQESTGAVEEEASRASRLAASTFTIQSVLDQRVFVKNTGSRTIDLQGFEVRVDDQSAAYDQRSPIEPGKTGEIRVTDLWKFGPGEHTLKVQGAAFAATKQVRVKPAAGLVLDLRFNEGAGTSAFDVSGNSNHGTLGDGLCVPGRDKCPLWAEGRSNKALKFDGTDDYVNVSNEEEFDFTDRVTVETWVRTSDTDSQNERIVSKGATAGFELTYQANVDRVDWIVHTASGDVTTSKTGLEVNDGEWHHLAASYDRSTSVLYIDGTLVASTNDNRLIDTNNANLLIGSQGAALHFNGFIDDVRVYSNSYGADELYVMEEV